MAKDQQERPTARKYPGPAALVAVILACGISISLILMTGAALYIVISTGGQPTQLGENTTQVLTGWGGGILGVLGAFVGYAFGQRDPKPDEFLPKPPKPSREPEPEPEQRRPQRQQPERFPERQPPPVPGQHSKSLAPIDPGTQGPGTPPPRR